MKEDYQPGASKILNSSLLNSEEVGGTVKVVKLQFITLSPQEQPIISHTGRKCTLSDADEYYFMCPVRRQIKE